MKYQSLIPSFWFTSPLTREQYLFTFWLSTSMLDLWSTMPLGLIPEQRCYFWQHFEHHSWKGNWQFIDEFCQPFTILAIYNRGFKIFRRCTFSQKKIPIHSAMHSVRHIISFHLNWAVECPTADSFCLYLLVNCTCFPGSFLPRYEPFLYDAYDLPPIPPKSSSSK